MSSQTPTSPPPPLRRLAILDDYQGVALKMGPWERLPRDIQVQVFRDTIADEDALAQRLSPYEALVIMRERTPFPASLIARLPNLRLLVTSGERNKAIDVAACTARGITVCGTRSEAPPTAELTWGLILSFFRHIPDEHRAMREGRWQTTLGMGLAGKTLGVIGLGRLGQRVARVGAAFGMRVLAWSTNLTAEAAAVSGAQYATKQELLRESDVVTLHLVLGDRSRGIIGASDLALMKPTALLVNTSRGPLVEEAALIAALREGRIGGAALDVYDQEPLPTDHPLRGLPNTVLTPHLGYVTEENYRGFFTQAVEDIEAWLAGAPVRELKP
jgi:phosphoglycerate dehydrogenase-like enzyme